MRSKPLKKRSKLYGMRVILIPGDTQFSHGVLKNEGHAMYPDVEERVDTLEHLVSQFITQTNLLIHRMERDTLQLKHEMSDFKHEMSDFKHEMSDFKNEVRQDQKARNKQWGELANKMGTLVEDLIAPAVRPVVKKFFHCDLEDFALHVRRKRKDLNLEGEFDIVAVSDTNQVFLIEVKSSPSKEYLEKFLENIGTFRQLFPEHAEKPLVPIFAALRFDKNLISFATRHRIYVLAYREWDYLDMLNFEEVQRAQSL